MGHCVVSLNWAPTSCSGLGRLGAPAARLPQLTRCLRPRRSGLSALRSLGSYADSSGSFDGEDDLDYSLSRELERLTEHKKYTKLASHLELLYNVQAEVRRPSSRPLIAYRKCLRLRVAGLGSVPPFSSVAGPDASAPPSVLPTPHLLHSVPHFLALPAALHARAVPVL